MKTGDDLRVFWNDTASDDDWKDEDEGSLNIIQCKTTGQYIKHDDDALYMVATTSTDNCRFGEVTIPRGCITEIVALRSDGATKIWD